MDESAVLTTIIHPYQNQDRRCNYPATNFPGDYCWSYAHHIDGTTGYEDMLPICRQCDLWCEMLGRTEQTSARCFRRLRDDAPSDKRRGVWIMTRPTGRRGAFFHGDREEVQGPHWSLEDLQAMSISQGDYPFRVDEISADDALVELASWPEAQEWARTIFARHPVDEFERTTQDTK